MWSRACLGEVATINMGQSPPSSTVNEDGNGLPFVQGNAEFGPRNPLPIKFCSKPQKQARRGDILLSVRAPVGALNLANKTLCIGRGLSAITPTIVDAEFLWHALHWEVSDLARVSQGSTFSAVNKADLFRLEIPRPPLPEQRKIAAILSSVDDGIEKTQAVIDQVQVVKRGLMQQLLTRGLPGRHTRFKQTEIGEIPEEWRVVQLGSVCLDVSDGPHFSPKYVDRQNGVPFLSARNIRVDGWALGDVKYVSRQDHSTFCKRSHPAPGDLLYTKGGTVGIARVNDLPFDFSIWVHIALLKLRKECIHEWFLAAMLNSPPCYRQALLYTHGTSNRDLGITRMVRIQFPLPPLQEQIEIAERLRTVDQRNTRELESLAQLKLLKSALMSVLLTGELRVTSDTEDS